MSYDFCVRPDCPGGDRILFELERGDAVLRVMHPSGMTFVEVPVVLPVEDWVWLFVEVDEDEIRLCARYEDGLQHLGSAAPKTTLAAVADDHRRPAIGRYPLGWFKFPPEMYSTWAEVEAEEADHAD